MVHIPGHAAALSRALAIGLFFGQISHDWYLETFAVKCVDQHDKPQNKECQANEGRNEPCSPTDEWNTTHDEHPDIDHDPCDAEKDGLPGVKAHGGIAVERLDDQEDDSRDDGNVSQAGCGIIAEAGLRCFNSHGSSLSCQNE